MLNPRPPTSTTTNGRGAGEADTTDGSTLTRNPNRSKIFGYLSDYFQAPNNSSSSSPKAGNPPYLGASYSGILRQGYASVKEDGFATFRWKRKWLTLRSDMLSFHKNENTPQSSSILLADVVDVDRSGSKPQCVSIKTKDHTVQVSFESNAHAWQDDIYLYSPARISNPFRFAHNVHVSFDPITGTFNGLPTQWTRLLAGSSITKGDYARNSQAVLDASESDTSGQKDEFKVRGTTGGASSMSSGDTTQPAGSVRASLRRLETEPLSPGFPPPTQDSTVSSRPGYTSSDYGNPIPLSSAGGDKPGPEGLPNGYDQDISTFEEEPERLEPSLVEMMMDNTPNDLTGQVTFPDLRERAQGGFADVYTGLWNEERVAVKRLRIRKSRKNDAYWEASNERRITREMHVWSVLKHRNICEFLGYLTDFGDYPSMVSTWCSGGNASEYLETQSLSLEERVRMTQDVANGLEYLHHLKVIHGDLKPTNVLVDDDGVAKLCDFGLVKLADWNGPAGMTTTSPYTGTERYKAPELFISEDNRHPVATFDGDIYSLGCIMLEFIEQIYPFQRFKRPQDMRDAIMDGSFPALRSESQKVLQDLTEAFWDLLEECWGDAPARPSIAIIVDYLQDFGRGTTSTQDPSNA